MKNLVITFLILFTLSSVNSQEVKNQTEHIKSLKIGKYLFYYIDKDKKTGKYSYRKGSGSTELSQVFREKNFPEHTYLEFNGGAGAGTRYLPDNMAFPITLASIYYEGNPKMQKEIGYVPYEIRPGRTNRRVVHNGIIYNYFSDFYYDDPKTYVPSSLYVHESYGKENEKKKPKKKKKKKKSFFGQLASLGDPKTYASLEHYSQKELRKQNPAEKVVEYLKKAVPKQKQEYKKWISKPVNKSRINNLEERRELIYKAMNNYNEALKQTPEWKRIQENNKFWEKHEAKNNTTIQNNTGKDIYIYEEGSRNGDRLFNDGSRSYKCNNTYYYSFSGNASWREAKRISGTNCGATATVR